ncbi:hypothetical protein BD408DRAFT_426047 [Parasitella parasitica]|nr:hypothetical protein BD408DRAFT_426047 [Parasitella parasitica]
MMHPLPSLKAMKTMTGGRIGGYISFSQVLMTDCIYSATSLFLNLAKVEMINTLLLF